MSEEITLSDTLNKYNIQLSPKKVRLLEQYCEELWSWNEKINLTRHTDYEKFVTRDLIDSMQLAEQLQKGEHVLDVGTGGGVPGIVLAVIRPDLTVELCDSTGKKAEAVGAIVDALKLDLNVWYAKAEDLVRVHRFHTLVVRAVSRMEKLLEMFAPCWFAFDRILMVKGPHWVDERGEARHFGRLTNLALRKVAEYENPGTECSSVILQVCRKNRMEEMEQRTADRLAGLPIQSPIENVGVDNAPPKQGRSSQKSAGRSVFSSKNSKENVISGNKNLNGKNPGRKFRGKSDERGKVSFGKKRPRRKSTGSRSPFQNGETSGTRDENS